MVIPLAEVIMKLTPTLSDEVVTPVTRVKKEHKLLGRKRGKEERMEKVMEGMVEKILKAQAESDCKFLELEEKRRHLEEREMEKEEKIKRGVPAKDNVNANS